jgi:hypothetical protein
MILENTSEVLRPSSLMAKIFFTWDQVKHLRMKDGPGLYRWALIIHSFTFPGFSYPWYKNIKCKISEKRPHITFITLYC